MRVQAEKLREEIKQKYDVKEVFDAIEGFLAKQSQLSSSRVLSFEQQIADRTARMAERDAKLGAIAANLFRLKNQYLLLHRVIEAKCVDLTAAIVEALNKEDYLLVGICARSLIEHAAFLAYLVQEAKTEDIEALSHLYGKSLYSSRFFGQEGLVDTLDLLDMVTSYVSSVDDREFTESYSALTDFVHPAFSSNVMMEDGTKAEDVKGPSPEDKEAAIRKLLRILGAALGHLDEALISFASVGTTIEEHIRKTTLPGATRRSFAEERPSPPKQRVEKPSPPEEPVPAQRGPLGGAIFFNRRGRTWMKY